MEKNADALIRRARRREPQAWAEIYELYSSQIYGFLLHQVRSTQVAEDLTGDVFLEALQAAERFSGTIEEMRSWLFRICRNNLIDYYRQAHRRATTPLEAAEVAEVTRWAPAIDPEEEALASLDRGKVREAIERLSPDQKEVVLLRLVGGLTSAEVAGILGKTIGAVKALQHRAIGTLARSLKAERPTT